MSGSHGQRIKEALAHPTLAAKASEVGDEARKRGQNVPKFVNPRLSASPLLGLGGPLNTSRRKGREKSFCLVEP